MIALGWTLCDGPVPNRVMMQRRKGVTILFAEKPDAEHARDRLALQVSCFNGGLDFLPIAPRQLLNLKSAIKISACEELGTRLNQLKGSGQLTLSLTASSARPEENRDGRSWLTARKARQDHVRQAALVLHDLVACTNLPVSSQSTRHDAQCHLLVKRHQADAAKDQLAERVKDYRLKSNETLVVTGLWPPYNFVDISLPGAMAA